MGEVGFDSLRHRFVTLLSSLILGSLASRSTSSAREYSSNAGCAMGAAAGAAELAPALEPAPAPAPPPAPAAAAALDDAGLRLLERAPLPLLLLRRRVVLTGDKKSVELASGAKPEGRSWRLYLDGEGRAAPEASYASQAFSSSVSWALRRPESCLRTTEGAQRYSSSAKGWASWRSLALRDSKRLASTCSTGFTSMAGMPYKCI